MVYWKVSDCESGKSCLTTLILLDTNLREVHDLNILFMNICDFMVLCCQRAGICGNQKILMLCICNDFLKKY